MNQMVSPFAFGGGLDTNTAALMVPPGRVIASLNYEPLGEGYGRVPGIERYDGRPAPSAAAYWVLNFEAGSATFAPGDIVTGSISGATAVVLGDPLDVTGSWSEGTAAGSIMLTNPVGSFIDSEMLLVSAIPRARGAGVLRSDPAVDLQIRKDRLYAAQQWYRDQIGAVPGSGPVRGVTLFNGTRYAWRDNTGATACAMWQASPVGWVAVPLGHRIEFTAGLAEIADGETITGAISGATAIAARVVRKSGDWGSSAAGYIILTGITGTFGAEAIKVGAVQVATVTPASPITLPPGGSYRTIEHNFYGAANRKALYGVNGVGLAFEFHDGVICPIETGTVPDAPFLIFEIANHLGLIFPGGSVQMSAIGEPLIYDVIQGASEVGFGTEITDVSQSNESAVALFGESKIGILSGRDSDTFQLAELTEEAGAYAGTVQRIGRTIYLDRRGLRDLSATQSFGNFKAGAISSQFERYFRTKFRSGAVPVGSIVCRAKSQYRLYWSDGTGLSVYMGGKAPEPMEFDLGGIQPTCFATGEDMGGEVMLIGAENGYVYQVDSGPNFDGAVIKAFLTTPFNHFGEPVREDRYHKVVIELESPPGAEIGIITQFDYGDGDKPVARSDFIVNGGGGNWSEAVWNSFFWSAASEGRAECFIDGIGRNASFVFFTQSHAVDEPHILQAYIVYRTKRKFKR